VTPDTQAVARREPSSDYFNSPGLSNSGLKDLAISPLRFWYLHLNPNRPIVEPTHEMHIGSAFHCAILEPDQFDQRYCRALNPDDYPGLLTTAEDMRGWLKSKGLTPHGTRKEHYIDQIQRADPNVPILEVLYAYYAAENVGKVIFGGDDWERVQGMAGALREEPNVAAILQDGKAEVALTGTDPDTGVLLKGKLDWLAPTLTMDLKSFTQKRGKSIARSIADAIFWERYWIQSYFYALLRGWPKDFSGETVLAFAESEEPHEVRLRRLLPKAGGQPNLYWTRAALEVRELIRVYAECMEHFGVDKPWKYAQEISTLDDQEMKGIAFD